MGSSQILFTDLDGTLLDHHTYLPGPALQSLRQLLARGMVVYFCSAKTVPEQKAIAHQFDVRVGIIAENGGVIVEPGGDEHVPGVPRERILGAIQRIRKLGVQVEGYFDMTPEEVAETTGLDAEAAVLARQRACSETLVEVVDVEHLAAELAADGLKLQRGARFWTVQGDHDKGMAVRMILERSETDLTSYAIGDSVNDIEMLRSVQHPMQVRAYDGNWVEMDIPGIVRLDGIGPDGWVLAAESIAAGRI